MKIGKTFISTKQFLISMGLCFGALVIPKISEPIISILTSIRDKISSMFGGKK